MVGDLRQASALLRSSKSNKSCSIQQINNSGHSPEVDEQGNNNNLVDVNIRVGDNQACGCGSLAADTLKDPESANSQHKETTVAMHRGLLSESSKNQDHRIVQTNTSADSASGNNSDLDTSRDSSTSDASSYLSGINKLGGYVTSFGDLTQPTRASSNVTVPLPSAESSEQSKDNTESDQELKSRLTSSRQPWALPSSGSQDKSMMPTLDENQELHVPSSVRAGIVPLPQMPGRISQAMMGRRHSMDSNIGRSRPPTFVRTYREVKWKRVSKPPKLRQMPRTSSTGNVAAAAAADSGGEAESESREYITGTHIIRQRVPIFMTSGDPPDPMGRRFSAGDLIPLTGPGQHWAPNGKCLVIRDMVPSKLAETSSSDDSGSSSSTPSSSEDVRSTHSSGSRHSNIDRDDHCEFSLIDEDDEDNDDSSEDGSDEDEDCNLPSKTTDGESTLDPSTNSSSSSPSSDNVLSKKSDVQKPFDLRRLALENSLQQKTVSLHQTAVSNSETLPQTTTQSTDLLPTLFHPSAATSQLPVMVSATMQPAMVLKDALLPTTAHVHSTMTMSPTPAAVSTAASQPHLLPATLQLPLIPISAQLATISASLHTKLVSDADAGVQMPALPLSSGITPLSSMMSSAASQNILTVKDQTPLIPSIPHPATIPVTVSSPARADGKPSAVGIISEDAHDFAAIDTELHPKLSHETDAQQSTASRPSVPRPASPYEMPWVLTSTKIDDANVYVCSSCSPDSHTSIRSAHWISPRNVEGTIPINLDDARAIRVETVSVPTTSGDETLQFQKVSYSSGFIISSAQWVAPTEVKESSPNGVKSVATGTLLAQGSDVPDPTSGPGQKVPAITGTTTPPTSKKIRKKYVPRSTGFNQQPNFSTSEPPASLTSAPQLRRPRQKIPVVRDQKASAVPRKLKRNFIVDTAIRDPLQMLESELCTQLSSPSMGRSTSPSMGRSTSPAITKRRFIVQKVPQDPLSSNLATVKNLSPVFNVVSTPLHRARGFVLKDLKESAFKSGTEGKEASSPLAASSQENERVSRVVVSPEKPSVNITLSLATSSVSSEDNAQSVTTSAVSETETTADSMRSTNAVGESGLAVESTHLMNALGKLELAAESVQLQNQLSRSEPATERTQLNHAISETERTAERTQLSHARSERERTAESTRQSSAASETEPAVDELELSSEMGRLESAAELVACVNVVRKQESVTDCAPSTGSGHCVVTDSAQSSTTTNQKPFVDTTRSITPRIELETVPLTPTLTKTSSIEVANSTQSETSLPGTTLNNERQPPRETSLPLKCERSGVSPDACLRSQARHSIPHTLQGVEMVSEDVFVEPSMAAASSVTPAPGSKGCELEVLPEKASSQAGRSRLRTDNTDDDELFLKENDALLRIILSSLSDSEELAGLDQNLCGGSTVAIDNKIEQAMDLVKRHLMYAVREEVEILKQQIGEMMERIGQLEYENSILRSEAKPETLSKLQQPRLPQSTPQAVLPSQPQPQTASVLLTPAPQHPAVPQVQPSQQQPTAVSQVGQPPSTT